MMSPTPSLPPEDADVVAVREGIERRVQGTTLRSPYRPKEKQRKQALAALDRLAKRAQEAERERDDYKEGMLAFQAVAKERADANEALAKGVEQLAGEHRCYCFPGEPSLLTRAEAAEAREHVLREALTVALDCKGSYSGTVSELGGDPALCTKCEDAARAALATDPGATE